MYYQTINSALGNIMIVADNTAITHIHFIGGKHPVEINHSWVEKETPVIRQCIKQLQEYFKGKRQDFTITLNPAGTPFQNNIWQALQTIPYGKTVSYLDIARQINNPKACRAVGAANGKNPIAIVIPCHRVIGNNGKLTGYAGGLDIKSRLLSLENCAIFDNQP